MDKSTRIKLLAVALVCTALGSVATFALARERDLVPDSAEGPQLFLSFILSKSYGSGPWVKFPTYPKAGTLISLTVPNMPSSFYYHVVCDGCAEIGDGTTITIWTSADSAAMDSSTIRYYDGPEKTGIHTERVYYLGPGSHTFYFRGQMYPLFGKAQINYHTITVTVYTDGSVVDVGGAAEPGINPD